MNQTDLLRALLNNPPVSVAPDGGALYFVPVSTLRRGTGYLDYCEPVAVPTSGDTVGPCVQNLSSHTGSVAAAGDNTASNLVGEGLTNWPHAEALPVTHRDLSQHADAYLTNGFEIVVPRHAEVE